MSNWDRMPGTVTLEEGSFPYAIYDEASNASSVVVISTPQAEYTREFVSSDLFYIAGASIDINDVTNGRITLAHSFGTDVERDRSRVAVFNVSNLMPVGAYGNSIVYSGWLTSACFYPEEYQDGVHEVFNPFKGAEPYEGEDEYDAPVYPFNPPKVVAGTRLTCPMQVEVRLLYNVTGDVKELVNGWRERIVTAQAEKDAERAEALRVEEEKRAERAAAYKEWLETPEGKVELAGQSLVRAMKLAYPLKDIKGQDGGFVSAEVVKEIVEQYESNLLVEYLQNEFWSSSPSVWKEFLNQAKALVNGK